MSAPTVAQIVAANIDAHPNGFDAVGIKRITGTDAFAANTVAITDTGDSE